ncbi:MAG TPA: TlpA disulfide reductase family protein [Gaiellaceae bacterium]|jgi:peroxiredoxin|nr:TlpA disulfide reductase family protein [Gaiellaceae bacterium]
MGKAARNKRARQAPRVPTPPSGGTRQDPRRLVMVATAGVVIVVGIVVVLLLTTRSSPKTAAQSTNVSGADRNAPASLVSAASAVGFHPTTEPGVGTMEGQPASAAQAPSNPNLLAVGKQAPSFTLQTPQGTSVSLSSFRGKAVLLEFFATWCPHCNAEEPHLERLYASLPKSKVAFVAVNADGETAPSVYAFHRYYGMQYPALVDPGSTPGSFHTEGSAGKVTTTYHVEAFPTFYVIDPQGKIAWRSDGEQPDALLRQQLVQAGA